MSCNTRSVLLYSAIMLIVGVLVIVCLSGALGRVPLPSPTSSPGGELRRAVNDQTKVLRMVHTVFRHGPRTPADTFPTDPHVNETYYPVGWGQITNDGKKVLFEMGEWLRKRYDDYLGEIYFPDNVWAQSTGVTRTQVSMATVLAGMFPPKNTVNEWNRRLNWQPIPVFSQPLDEDSLLLVRTPCPRYHEALLEVFEDPAIKQVMEKYKPLFEELTTLTGLNVSSPDDVQSVFSTLLAEKEFGLKLADWTDKYFPDRMLELTELSYIYNVYTDELKKLKAGPFLEKMIKEWQQKRTATLKPQNRKIFMYTGHDSTVVNVLAALGVWEQQLPVYGIMGIFELLEDIKTGEYGIQIYLRNSAKSGAIPLSLPGCAHFCPLDKFVEITRNVIPVNFALECLAKDSTFVTPPPTGP